MPSQLDATQICNLALDRLSEAPIVSIDDTESNVARLMRRLFWPTVRTLLAEHPWKFAIARATLAELADAPAFGWAHAYQLPTDCLRVLPLTHDGSSTGRPVACDVEGDQLMTNVSGPLRVRYIRDIDNTGRFTMPFIEVLRFKLASEAAHQITGKASFAQSLDARADTALQSARIVNALEGKPGRIRRSAWIDARHGI